MTLGRAHIIQGNALALPLPDSSHREAADVRCTAMKTGQLGDYRCVLNAGHASDHVWDYPPRPAPEMPSPEQMSLFDGMP